MNTTPAEKTSLTYMTQQNPQTQNFQIINATWRDLGPLRQIEQECFGEDAWPLIDLIGVLTIPGIIRLKAVVDGTMVGFAACNRNYPEGACWVATIGVSKAFRKLGVGSAILSECEKRASLPLMRLSVRASNEEAIRLYQKYGYIQYDRWKHYYASGEDAIVMEKKIDIPTDSIYHKQ